MESGLGVHFLTYMSWQCPDHVHVPQNLRNKVSELQEYSKSTKTLVSKSNNDQQPKVVSNKACSNQVTDQTLDASYCQPHKYYKFSCYMCTNADSAVI